MIYVILFVLGLILGGMVSFGLSRDYWRRTSPTVQEQIEAVMQLSDKGSGDDLLKLMEKRLVHGTGGQFSLSITDGMATIKTPTREHLYLVLQDIPKFAAMVAIMEVEKDAA
jgi:hypothetical protein